MKENKQKETLLNYRPPIVALMGHVDHGKTSILDAIRNTNLTAKESGGITQHTGAYTVTKNDKKIIFIDTPGHEAFSQMRSRGGKASDIVVIVVAANDGVMPQTKEAIFHAKNANVPIIVAINKVDIEGVDITKVKKQLVDNNVLVEGYGGDTVCVEVSATKNTGIDDLIDTINLVSELNIERLKASITDPLNALVIESKHTKRQGGVVSAVIRNGVLKLKDEITALSFNGGVEARVKAMINGNGDFLKEAPFGEVVDILGFTKLPMSGDKIVAKGSITQEKLVLEEANEKPIETQNSDSKTKSLNIVIRADTIGTLEALLSSISKLEVDETKVNIISSGVGDIKESDILLAVSSKAIVIAFRVKIESSIQRLSEEQKVIVFFTFDCYSDEHLAELDRNCLLETQIQL